MKQLIAKTQIGREFYHSKTNAFFAAKNAQKIADILTENKFKLNPGEKWHVYDYDYGQDFYVAQRIYINNKGVVKAAWI